MTRRSGLTGPPNGYLTARGSWPAGPFRRDTPRAVQYAAEITKLLLTAVEASGLNVSQVAAGLGIARSTYYDVISGQTFPDIHTLAVAEQFFGVRLWPEHSPALDPGYERAARDSS